MKLASLITLIAFVFTLGMSLAVEPTTPKMGSDERKAIMDGLRVSVQSQLKNPVVFKVNKLRVLNGWAFLDGVPVTPEGGKFDYSRSPYAEAIRDGHFDDGIVALLHKVNGKWMTVRFVIGATDVEYLNWAKAENAPAAIFE